MIGFQLCLVEDRTTKRHLPRNYLQTLEDRVALLESILQQLPQGVASAPLTPCDFHGAENEVDNFPGPHFINNDYGNKSSIPRAKQQEDEVGDLASKVGLLALNAPGAEAHYLGSSSAFAFSRLINTSLRQVDRRDHINALSRNKAPESIVSPCPLPDYDTAVMLSNAYFHNVHPQYPFLHEATFRDWEASLRRPEALEAINTSFVPLFFLNIVYAIGALLLPHSGYSAERFYVSAELHIGHVLALDNLEAIQAVLCCAMYSIRSPIGPSVWKLSGLALRHCIELGYHRSANRFRSSTSPLQLELRKRVFWCAYGLDCSSAITLGRPLGIAYEDVDVEYPMDIDDFHLTNTSIYETPQTSSPEPTTNMSRAIHTFRLRRIWARIHTALYSDSRLHSPANSTYHDPIHDLRVQLDNWLASTPRITSHVGPSLSVFSSTDWFDLTYNHSILLLYRGLLTDSTRRCADKYFIECMQAAEKVCQGYRRQYMGTSTSFTWGSLHLLVLAGLTYLHCIWTSARARETVRQDKVSSTCTDCTIVLVLMAERWEAAGPYRDIFQVLASRTMTMMVDKISTKVTLPCDPAQLIDPVPGDLAQWMAEITDLGMEGGIDPLLTGFISSLPPPEQEGNLGPSREDLLTPYFS
ncbi:uncharacterized protein N7482_009020 [Penicillium canariense]|uniref:Xylanolytic transcriptional activator regulatory domain-containing protein n=1 Tax=Penicillium canariense TaxID=189055 RepID=A0A9W9HXD5_9EURO|nr:uncharacterized protein N7482_009020 [Penicillium canariense]KAJ5157920.1 hypothetical protein N7482_009020 [Penicillium canariense]